MDPMPDYLKTLFLHPPSFEGFDGGAGSRFVDGSLEFEAIPAADGFRHFGGVGGHLKYTQYRFLVPAKVAVEVIRAPISSLVKARDRLGRNAPRLAVDEDVAAGAHGRAGIAGVYRDIAARAVLHFAQLSEQQSDRAERCTGSRPNAERRTVNRIVACNLNAVSKAGREPAELEDFLQRRVNHCRFLSG